VLAAEKHQLTATPKTVVLGYFDAKTPPVLRVRSGDMVELEALPAGGSRALEAAGVPRNTYQPTLLELERELSERSDYPHILTGPIFIEGAEPGDVLEIRIISVECVVPYGWNAIMAGGAFLSDDFPLEYFRSTTIDLERKVAKFSTGIEIPLRPFFGVMGVAPPVSAGRISSGPPWIHAGNMDNKELGAGTTLYLPVHVSGALFSAGDGHAVQGDGEVCGTAIETSLRGTFQLSVRKDMKLRWPCAETATHYISMGFHENLEQAAKVALREMIDFLVTQKGSRLDAYVLCSNAADLHITQVVDGNKGVHAMLPKAIFVR